MSYSLNEIDLTKASLMGDKILVRPIKNDGGSGLIIPDNAKEKPTIGQVILVGNGKVDDKIIPILINVGDSVIFYKWSGNDIKINNEILICLKQSDIILTIGA